MRQNMSTLRAVERIGYGVPNVKSLLVTTDVLPLSSLSQPSQARPTPVDIFVEEIINVVVSSAAPSAAITPPQPRGVASRTSKAAI